MYSSLLLKNAAYNTYSIYRPFNFFISFQHHFRCYSKVIVSTKCLLFQTDYANFGDNIDPNNLNEIGQIASTGISDSNLQRLLGQLINGQFAHGHHTSPSQSAAGVGGLPSDSSQSGTYDSGASEVL